MRRLTIWGLANCRTLKSKVNKAARKYGGPKDLEQYASSSVAEFLISILMSRVQILSLTCFISSPNFNVRKEDNKKLDLNWFLSSVEFIAKSGIQTHHLLLSYGPRNLCIFGLHSSTYYKRCGKTCHPWLNEPYWGFWTDTKCGNCRIVIMLIRVPQASSLQMLTN